MRRRPYALPFPDQVPLLIELALAGPGPLRPADPGELVEAAVHHGLAGHALAAARSGRLELPHPAVSDLSRVHRAQVVRSTALRLELPKVAEVVAGATGSEPVLLKGPAFADRFEPDPDRRPFGDLDLLVPRDRLDAAARALRKRGFEELVEFDDGFAARYGHDIHLRRAVGNGWLDVELHWRMGDDPVCEALDHGAFAPDAEPLALPGRDVLVPSPADQLLVAAVHLLSDRARKVGWLLDVVNVARALGDQQWHDAFARADARGLGWAVDRSLDYARHHLRYERERPRGPVAPPPFGPLRAVEASDAPVALHAGRLAAMEGWRERATYLRTVVAPPEEGLRGTVGHDGTGGWRLAARHARAIAGGFRRRRW
ncbi:MAG TPA: nucleotidyltransferase family protein [Solirubrobacteraceae bacterium]|jgi:hypothetical protein